MNNTFVEEIRNAVAEALEGKIVEVREVEKANGVMYTGLSIRTEGSNIAPIIYINEDESVEENARAIVEVYKKNQPADVDVNWVMDYEKVKDKLGVMLTSKPMKGLAKRKAPGFDDLYMHAFIFIKDQAIGMGNIKVKQEMLDSWGVSNARLFADALKSAPNVMPEKKQSMAEMLMAMGGPEMELDDSMSVVTTENGALGAAAILYTKIEENTYLIPSSVHEVILIKGELVENNSIPLNMFINDVNSNVLNPEDYLSNHAYRYNGKKWENIA